MAGLARDIHFDPARLFHEDGRPKQLQELDEATRLALRASRGGARTSSGAPRK